jgi:hypothetical protein
MRKVSSILLLMAISVGLLLSCAKYKDPKGYDPHLPNHYCNDPLGVNYNWDFPGVPDNTTCFYPTDVFAGKYLFHDSMFLKSNFLFIGADSFILTIKKVNNLKMSIFGLCANGDGFSLTATPIFTASVDTTVGDSLSSYGQLLCSLHDTLTGSISQNRIDSTITISLQVASDTGVTTLHLGSAKLIR